MKNKIIAVLASLIIALSPMSTVNAQSSSGSAAGGMSVGTAIAIGVVGAALLVALGDSSSSAPAAVLPQEDSGATESEGTTPAQGNVSLSTTTTTN